MTVAMTQARRSGARAVACASTGNTSASLAAYASQAGIPAASRSRGTGGARQTDADARLRRADAARARELRHVGLTLAREASVALNIQLLNSINPFRLEGQKTGDREVADALGRAPDALALPVGNAGNITAYWAGFRRLADARGTDLPRMLGFQAAGAAPIVRDMAVDPPETLATAIRIGNPASWHAAVAARDESGGLIDSVTDDEILDAQRGSGSSRESSASRPRRPASPACVALRPRGVSVARRSSSASLPATGSRIRTRSRPRRAR